VHVRAHRLSRRAGPQPGQRGYAAAGKAFRQLATLGAASLQAALAPIIKRGNIDAWQMRAPALVLSPDTAATHPGRAVLRSRQVLAAKCAWSRSVPGRGVCLVAGRGQGWGRVRLMSRRSCVIRVLPAPVRILPIRLGPGWRGGAAGASWDGGRGAEPLTDGRGRVWLCSGGAPLVRA